jgi:AP2-like factor (ANT lineage)
VFAHKGDPISVCLKLFTDWRHHAEAKGPKLEDFLSGGYSNDRSSGIYDDGNRADQLKYHQDVHAFPADSYYRGHGGGGIIGLDINNAPPCAGLSDHRSLAPQDHHHHFMPPHHGHAQYALCTPNQGAGTMQAAPMYNAAAGFDGSMSISGIKSWLRQSMYMPERSSAVPPSVAVPAPIEPPLPAPSVPVPRKLAQTFGQRTSQFRGVTRLVILVLQFRNVVWTCGTGRSWIDVRSRVALQAQMDGEVRGTPVGQHLQEGRPDQERETRYIHA